MRIYICSLVVIAFVACSPAQGAGVVGAVTSPECVACAQQIVAGIAAKKGACDDAERNGKGSADGGANP